MKRTKMMIMAICCCLGLTLWTTSCVNQDNYAMVRQNILVKLHKNPAESYWTDSKGLKLMGNYDVTNLTGQMYVLYCEYDQFKVSPNLRELPITILSAPECVDGKEISQTYTASNAPMYTLKYKGNGGFLFDRYTMAFPMYFWSIFTPDKLEFDKEMKRHAFSFSYDKKDFSAETGSLTLTLSHVVTDEPGSSIRRTEPTTHLLTFDLEPAVREFEVATGRHLEKIAVRSQVNSINNLMTDTLNLAWKTDTIAYEFYNK